MSDGTTDLSGRILRVLPLRARGLRVAFLSALLGALAGAAIGLCIRPQWEATAFYETALIGGGNLDSVPALVEQIRSRSFIDDVSVTARKNGITDANELQLLRSSLRKTRPHVLVGFVDLRVRAYSRAHASQFIEWSLQRIQQLQAERKVAVLDEYRKGLAALQEEMATVRADSEALKERIERISGDKAILAWLMDYTAQQNLLAQLYKNESELQLKLAEHANRPGRLLVPIEVSEEPITPRLLALAVFGMLVGLALGVTLLQLRR